MRVGGSGSYIRNQKEPNLRTWGGGKRYEKGTGLSGGLAWGGYLGKRHCGPPYFSIHHYCFRSLAL